MMTRYKVGAPHIRRKQKPNIGEAGNYRVQYIDGHDMKYKVFDCYAKNRVDAIRQMWEQYTADFDHQIIDVYIRED